MASFVHLRGVVFRRAVGLPPLLYAASPSSDYVAALSDTHVVTLLNAARVAVVWSGPRGRPHFPNTSGSKG